MQLTKRLASASARLHITLKPTFHSLYCSFPFPAHKCWLCGYSMPCRLQHKLSDKQKQAWEQGSRCKHSSSQTSMGQTWLKSKQRWVFISAHQSPISSCFLGLRHTAGCVSISTASIIRQTTDDRTLEVLLRHSGLLDVATGLVAESPRFTFFFKFL